IPRDVITNAELLERIDTTDEWIVAHTGMRERRRAPADWDTSDLGADATRAALERTGWAGDDVDLLVCATSTPDRLIPATASFISKKLGIDPVAFDVNAACSSFVYGLAVVEGLMGRMGYQRAALCTAEKYTRVTDYTDRSTCIFFGDSAATVLLQTERPERGLEVVDVTLENCNEGADYVTTFIGGYFWQDGRRVKEYALRSFEKSARDMLARHDLAIGDIRAFCGHQANLRVLEQVGAAIGLRPEQHWHNVAELGNQGAAGVATAFCTRLDEHRASLRDGDLFLLTVFGSGFTYASALLRWVDAGV
ncbi:MAG TPA: ketoacyl-ACP synthase III, partial [Planctomycetota bacterium]|nr:ketoacyl-ACP synthase III [Planctomycetota bacterium]